MALRPSWAWQLAAVTLPHDCEGARCRPVHNASYREDRIVLHRTPDGQCRVCLEIIWGKAEKATTVSMRTWHRACLHEHWLRSGQYRDVAWARDEGLCAACGKRHERHGYWAADHIVPLIDGGGKGLDNLQTLCERPCHKDKTTREAAERAARRKAERLSPIDPFDG